MININFRYSPERVLVELNLKNVSEIIFYIIDRKDGAKIFIEYLQGRKIVFDKNIIENKNVVFQFYYIEENEKKSTLSGPIVYKSVSTQNYSLVIGKDDYDDLKDKGYFSVDKKNKIELNNIKWVNGHRNFDFNVNALRFLSSYWARFYKTFEFSVLKEIYAVLKQYADYMISNAENKSSFINYDMAIGIRSIHICFMYEFENLLTEKEKKVLSWLKEKHIGLASNPKIFTLNNHGLWLIYGLRLLLKQNNDKDLSKLDYCFTQFNKLVINSFNSEAMNTENSPFYHQYNIDIYRRIPLSLFPSCSRLKEVLSNAPKVTPWLTDSLGYYYQIGDSDGKAPHKFSPQKYKVSVVDKNNQIFWKAYKASGYFILKNFSDNKVVSEIIFYNTSDSYVHKHLDGNSFIYYHRGKEIFADAGKYTYDYTFARQYFISALGHNTAFLEGVDLEVQDLNLGKTGFKEINEYEDRVEVDSVVTYENYFVHNRSLTMFFNKNIKIKDSFVSELDKNLVINFLLGENVVPEIKGDTIYLILEGELIGNMRLQGGAIAKKIFFGNEEPHKGWISKKYNIKRPAYAIEIIYPASTLFIETSIHFD